MVSKRGFALSELCILGKPVRAIKAAIGSPRWFFSFAAPLLCVCLILLYGNAQSVEQRALGADKPLLLDKTRWSDAGKSKQIRRDFGRAIPDGRKINFIYRPIQDEHLKTALNQQTPTPQGWVSYDGTIYSPERGYGWLTDLRGNGRDRGTRGIIVLNDGTETSAERLGRPELANFQGPHGENRPRVFRVDLPNGWYRVTCASVDPHPTSSKPLVDQRSFKCRAHDVVFAGANYGPPTVVGGRRLVEGSGIVEVTDGHLRIIVGDPAYAGWVWTHPGPLNKRWRRWWYDESRYANGWYQVLSRTVDPGFHSISMNSLQIERVAAPQIKSELIFRDFFNRDDSSDVNTGVPPSKRWVKHKLYPRFPSPADADLYNTAVRFTAPKRGSSATGLLQQQAILAKGTVRYSTRVSLFAGEGSQKRSGTQEAGVLLLAEPSNVSEFSSTFVGIRLVGWPAATKGSLVYSVGDGGTNYRTKLEVLDTDLPFKITEGEFEVVVEHDPAKNMLRRIEVNGTDVTEHFPLKARVQRISRGLYGMRSAIHNTSPYVSLRQFFWYYRVEAVAEKQVED